MENKQLLKMNGSDSEEDVKEFELPPARARRPKLRRAAAENKISQGSFCTCRGCISLISLVVLLSAFLLLGWYIIVMQQDINMLKQHLQQVEADDDSNLQSSTKLQQNVNGKLSAIAVDEKEIQKLKEKLEIAFAKINQLNQTVHSLQSHMTKAGSVASLSADVDRLKKGMADTGVEIQKLTDEQDDMKKKSDKLVSIVKSINQKIFNITTKVKSMDDNVSPVQQPTSPPVQSWQESPQLRNLAHKMLLLSQNQQGEQAKWKADLKNNSNYMKMEMYKLYSYLDVINETCQVSHAAEQKSIALLKNSTKYLGIKLDVLKMTFMPLFGALERKNASSSIDTAVITNRIKALTDVVDQQRVQVDNVTARLSILEELAKDVVASETSPTTSAITTNQEGSQTTMKVDESLMIDNVKRNSEAVMITTQSSDAATTQSPTVTETYLMTAAPSISSAPTTEEEQFEMIPTTTADRLNLQTTPNAAVKNNNASVENRTLPLVAQNISSNGTSEKTEIKPTMSITVATSTVRTKEEPALQTTAVPATQERIPRTLNDFSRGDRLDILDEDNNDNPRDFNWNDDSRDDEDNLDDM